MIVSKDWVAKEGGEHQEAALYEEEAYMRNNPDEAFVRRIFDLAKIQYGCIEYSILGDKPQVWEINTNPVLLKSRSEYEKEAPAEIPLKEKLAAVIGGCLKDLDSSDESSAPVAERKITATEILKLWR